MLAADKHAAILNDLIRINNDRIAGYDTALSKLPASETVVRQLFESLREESQRFRAALINRVAILGAEVAADSTFSGKLFRTWMDIKAGWAGVDMGALVESCALGEDAWQKAYETVLTPGSGLPAESLELIKVQYNAGRQSSRLLKECERVLSMS